LPPLPMLQIARNTPFARSARHSLAARCALPRRSVTKSPAAQRYAHAPLRHTTIQSRTAHDPKLTARDLSRTAQHRTPVIHRPLPLSRPPSRLAIPSLSFARPHQEGTTSATTTITRSATRAHPGRGRSRSASLSQSPSHASAKRKSVPPLSKSASG